MIVCLFLYQMASAQEQFASKWAVSGSITPHFTNEYWSVFSPMKGIGITYQQTFKPAVNFNAIYKPFRHLSLQAGFGYNIYNTPIIQLNPYLAEYENDYAIYSGQIASNATIHLLELPGIINYNVIDKKKYGVFLSFGDVSSFVIAEANAADYGPRVQTTIYQNYLQFALGFELKTKTRWSFYASPMYRIAMVNYHDTQHYDIYAYPNVFYDRMLGLELGAKYNFLKKKKEAK